MDVEIQKNLSFTENLFFICNISGNWNCHAKILEWICLPLHKHSYAIEIRLDLPNFWRLPILSFILFQDSYSSRLLPWLPRAEFLKHSLHSIVFTKLPAWLNSNARISVERCYHSYLTRGQSAMAQRGKVTHLTSSITTQAIQFSNQLNDHHVTMETFMRGSKNVRKSASFNSIFPMAYGNTCIYVYYIYTGVV